MDDVRVRFAPSPTGYLHVGGARTALFNFLFARNKGGRFILRIEDTDLERSTREHERRLMDSLRWLKMEWDEGPDVGGDYGPYRQSERLDIYNDVVRKLMELGKAYEVYATPEEIEKLREDLIRSGNLPRYNRDMLTKFNTPDRIGRMRPAIFFEFEDKEYEFDDLIRGKITFRKGAIGDFVLMRSNGLPTYNFACVVDDHFMKITHVIRGDDHLSNTLRQLAIYEALGWNPPKFAHVSTILGSDGKKLSKRHNVSSIEGYRDRGYMPEAMINYLVLLGWSHPEGKEIMDLDEMIEKFSLDRISANPAMYDEGKLKWMNGYYIRNLDPRTITERAKKFIVKAGYLREEEFDEKFEWVVKVVESVRNGVNELSEIPSKIDFYFIPPKMVDLSDYGEDVLSSLRGFREELKKVMEWNEEEIRTAFKEYLKKAKVKRRDFYMALRLILTGRTEGPELLTVLEVLGKDEVLRRMSLL